ncbi:hypothetical protein, partial [Actinomadura roseirufa]|uniref:hypothetical protein n=1 Tax=Actinomadura roseirufa TaxID=2094049 RepID=UPI001041627C
MSARIREGAVLRGSRDKIAGSGSPLALLRAPQDGPDPRFRAGLRARLVAAAAAGRSEDGRPG